MSACNSDKVNNLHWDILGTNNHPFPPPLKKQTNNKTKHEQNKNKTNHEQNKNKTKHEQNKTKQNKTKQKQNMNMNKTNKTKQEQTRFQTLDGSSDCFGNKPGSPPPPPKKNIYIISHWLQCLYLILFYF